MLPSVAETCRTHIDGERTDYRVQMNHQKPQKNGQGQSLARGEPQG
jgi:hypothetical protein